MKKVVLFLVVFLLSLTLFAQARIEFDKRIIKFPKTKEGIKLNHTYKLTNIGNEPLILSEYEVACQCTKVSYSKSPILPNQTVDILVTFDTNHKIGWQDRIITIYSNAKNSPSKIRFKVMVDNKD